MDLRVLYEDNHILAVEKPAGILTQGDHSGDRSLLDEARDYIRKKHDKPGNVFIGLVHRLDREVSGIILFAKTSKAARRLHRQFIGKEIKKYYAAIVKKNRLITYEKKRWVELVHYLRKQRGYTEISDTDTGGLKRGELRYMAVEESTDGLLLLVELITGRKHQIRAQLASAGMPVSGDGKYGSEKEISHEGICLHSLSIHFSHPVKGEGLTLFSSLPPRFYGPDFTGTWLEDTLTEIIQNDLKTAGKKH